MKRSARCAAAVLTAFVLVGVHGATPAHAIGPTCNARVELEPRVAFVGQQVAHEIVIEGVAPATSIEWIHPPAFPDATATPLGPSPGAPGDPPDVRRERRALHPARAGSLLLPPTPFRCWPLAGAAALERATPSVTLEVLPAPEAGRPTGWRGLVGPVSIAVRALRPSVHVGETIELFATLSGEGRLRQAAFAWPEDALRSQVGSAELFPARPRFQSQPGARLIERRFERLEVVPHAPGVLEVPALAIDALDPSTGTFTTAYSEPVRVRVLPARAAADAADRGVPQERLDPDGDDNGAGPWIGASIVAGAVIVVAVRTLRRRRRLGRGRGHRD